DVERAARLERDVEAEIAELREQSRAARLRERLAAGHADVRRAVAAHLGFDLAERAPLPARERVRRVAVLAAQRATGEPHEHGGPAAEHGLALDREEDLRDPEPRGGRLVFGRCGHGDSASAATPRAVAMRAARPSCPGT